MGYDAQWTATDQVPQRLIDAGIYQGQPFGRFDSRDPSDGGPKSRYSLSGEWHHHNTDDGTATRVSAYAMRYRLQLWSNFSDTLDRPVEGDPFLQRDGRSVVGMAASHALSHSLAGLPARSESGVQLRQDSMQVDLFDTEARQIKTTTRDDNLRKNLLGVYGQSAVELTPWLRTTVCLRADHLRTRVTALSLAANSGATRGTQVSPKSSLIAGPF